MTRTRRILLIALALLGATAAPAGAQSYDTQLFSLLDDPSVTAISVRTVSLRASGSIDVRYGPDPASGCAAHAGCAYSGRLDFLPGGSAQIALTTLVKHGRRSLQAALLFDPSGTGDGLTYADVRRAQGGECTDAVTSGAASAIGRTLILALGDALGQTRCAAPLPADLTALLPHLRVAVAQLALGRHFELSASRHFSAHGFAGAITSTLTLTVVGIAKPFALTPSASGSGNRLRAVSVALRLTSSSGALTLHLRGATNPAVCAVLDSCGLGGTETLTSRPAASLGSLTAIGARSRPRRDFLTALGIATDGNPAGIRVTGTVLWHDGGTVTADVTQGTRCRDTAPMGDNLLFLTRVNGRIGVYAPLLSIGRTRCPGPMFTGYGTGLIGTIAPQPLGRRDVNVALRPFGSLDDDGYTVTQRGGLDLRLHRGRVTDRMIVSQLF